MGDGGSYFLGFAIAVISLTSSAKSQTSTAMLIPVLAMGVPMFDTMLSPVRRFMMGQGPFKPDTGHIHHKLVRQFGFTTRRAVLIIYTITAALCMLALILVNMKDEFAVLVFALLGGSAFVFIRKLGYLDHIGLDRIANWARDINYVSGMSKDRRSFLNLQMNVAGSNDDEEFWANVCTVLDWLNFDHAELSKKKTGGDSVVHLWSRGDFDDCRGICRQYLLKLELPLVDDRGFDHGTLWLIRDVREKPMSQHTFFRIEQLRRTIENALKAMNEIQVGNSVPAFNESIRPTATPIMVK
jgi:UDP-GlcNAc:undecaprenyl-phosphate GlcNAc-1-phosphate transferase